MSGFYFDYAATTPLDPHVRDAMLPWLDGVSGNVSARHTPVGMKAYLAFEEAKLEMTRALRAEEGTLIFTSGATEANNMLLSWASQSRRVKGVATTAIEHQSVLAPLEKVASAGKDINYLPLFQCGAVKRQAFEALCASGAFNLASIHWVNNEIGVCQPIAELAAIAHKYNVLLHVDMSQALGRVPLNLSELDVDFATFSAHKAYGPQGIGALYIRKEHQPSFRPMLQGGSQQQGLRAGTIPIALVVGFAKACQLAQENVLTECAHTEKLHKIFRDRLDQAQISYGINGHDYAAENEQWRVPHILNLHLKGVRFDVLQELLPEYSFSAGSACHQEGVTQSHVLTALGYSTDESLRLSFGRFTTEQDMMLLVDRLKQAVSVAQEMSILGEVFYG